MDRPGLGFWGEARQVVSPGGWRVPPGHRPGWNWVPPGGATVRLDRVPRWVRMLFNTPYLDRYAHEWMWFRGGWDVDPPDGLEPADAASLVWSTPAPRRRPTRPVPDWLQHIASLAIGVVDPAERHMRQTHLRGRRPAYRWFRWPRGSRSRTPQAAVLEAPTHGGFREPSAEELADMQRYAAQMHARYEVALLVARQRWGERANACARELIRDGVTVLQVDRAQVRGRLVSFWRGDSVLELESVGPDGEQRATSATRLTRRQETNPDVSTHYLLQHIAQLDVHTEPD